MTSGSLHSDFIGATGVSASTVPFQGAGPGSTPRVALQEIRVRPIPITVAKRLLVRHHYLHALPGGTQLSFGVFVGARMLGAITFGAGPTNAYRLVGGAKPNDCATLTRLWLSDELVCNSESRILGIVLREIRKHTLLKFLITYADPAQSHLGIIY